MGTRRRRLDYAWIAAACFSLSVVGAASAQLPPPPAAATDDLPAAPAPPGSPRIPLSSADDLTAFELLDGNEDGLLSGREAVSVLAYDTNGDKRVTKQEFMAAREKVRAVDPAVEDNERFSQLDGNEDDFLSGKEARGLERYDSNSDREISRAEFLAGQAADRRVAPPVPSRSTVAANFATFFASVAQHDAKAMMDQMDPRLQERIDEPILQFFVDAIHTDLGAMSDDKPRDWKQEQQTLDGAPVTVTTARVGFSRGEADCELEVQNGKVVRFKIDSDKLAELDEKLGERLQKDKAFFLRTSRFYAPRGEALMQLVFHGQPEQVHAQLHPDVQVQLPLADVTAYIQASREECGALRKTEYDGVTESYDLTTGKLKKLSVNFKLDCANGTSVGKVVIQFVGLRGVIVGFSISRQSEDAAVEPNATPTSFYRCTPDQLSERHAENFVPFYFFYPKNWKLDPKAGTEQSSNFVKVERNVDLGGGVTFTQENFAVGSCTVPGSGDVAKTMLHLLGQQLQTQIAKGFPEFKLNREGDTTFGRYEGVGFDFTSRLPHPAKGKVDCWGRVVLLAPSEIRQEKGLVLIMLATSEAPELKSLADLGVKGELPIIISLFKAGPAESDDPEAGAKATALYDRGVALSEQGDFAGSVAAFTELIQLEPDNSESYRARGVARYRNKDLRGAAADFMTVISIDPNDVEAHNNLGAMRYYLDDLDGAMEEYELALQLDDQYALAYCNRGLVKLLRQQDADAQRDFDRALALDKAPEFAAEQAELIRDAKLRRAKAVPAPPKTN